MRARRLVSNHLLDPQVNRAGDTGDGSGPSLADRFRDSASRLERFYQLCAMSREISERFTDLQDWRRDIAFFIEVRAWIVKREAANREARGEPLSVAVNGAG